MPLRLLTNPLQRVNERIVRLYGLLNRNVVGLAKAARRQQYQRARLCNNPDAQVIMAAVRAWPELADRSRAVDQRTHRSPRSQAARSRHRAARIRMTSRVFVRCLAWIVQI
jgi:hypothetical protein